MLSWLSQVSRPGVLLGVLAAGCLLLGVLANAFAQSLSDTRQLLLFDAVRQNNTSGVRSIILAGVDVARPDAGGRTAMDIAVEKGHFAVAQQLIFARQLQHQILTAIFAQPRPIPSPSPVAAKRERAQQVQVPKNQANQVAATRVQPATPAPQIPTAPINKLREAASNLSRDTTQNPDRNKLQARTAPKAIPSIPSTLSKPDNNKFTAPSQKPPIRQETSNMVGPSQTDRLLHLGSDSSVLAIDDDAIKTALTDTELASMSIEENFDFRSEQPLSLKPERKPDFMATSEVGASSGGTPAKVTNMDVESVFLQPSSPGLSRLRLRLKTISRDRQKLNIKTNKMLLESNTSEQATAPRKSQPLFLNRIFNSIADILGLGGKKSEYSQQ